VTIIVPADCKPLIDVVIRLLSLWNQVVAMTKRLRLQFVRGEQDMGYLDRMGFFDHLARAGEVMPARPAYSRASLHRGGNRSPGEIQRFSGTSAGRGAVRLTLKVSASGSGGRKLPPFLDLTNCLPSPR
jgi:hypothetical protein